MTHKTRTRQHATMESTLLDLVAQIKAATQDPHYQLTWLAGFPALLYVKKDVSEYILPHTEPDALQSHLEIYLEGIHAGYMAAKRGK